MDIVLLLLIGLFIYVAVSVYFISYSYHEAFKVYNDKLDRIYNEIKRKKKI